VADGTPRSSAHAAGLLSSLLRPGMTVALGDGFGAPWSVTRQLSEAAARCGGVRLILGWVPRTDPGLDLTAFADVRTFMPGWGLRRATDAGLVSFAPVRMSAVPALLHGPWRPDLLVATVVPAVLKQCTICHGGKEGRVLGAIIYEIPIKGAALERFTNKLEHFCAPRNWQKSWH